MDSMRLWDAGIVGRVHTATDMLLLSEISIVCKCMNSQGMMQRSQAPHGVLIALKVWFSALTHLCLAAT